MRQVFSLPGWSILHVAGVFPSGMEHFCMRQVRGGEAFVVAKAILPSSRSSPPGHAAGLRCGMCCFVGGAMDSTLLDVVGCAQNQGTGPLRGPLSRPASPSAQPDTLDIVESITLPIT